MVIYMWNGGKCIWTIARFYQIPSTRVILFYIPTNNVKICFPRVLSTKLSNICLFVFCVSFFFANFILSFYLPWVFISAISRSGCLLLHITNAWRCPLHSSLPFGSQSRWIPALNLIHEFPSPTDPLHSQVSPPPFSMSFTSLNIVSLSFPLFWMLNLFPYDYKQFAILFL